MCLFFVLLCSVCFLRSRGGCIDNFMALCIINLNHSCFYFLTARSMESWVSMKNVVGLSLRSLWQYPVFIPRLDFHNSKCISTHCTWAKIVLIILLQTPFHVQNYRGLFDMLVNLSISNLTKMTMKSCLCHLFLIPIYNVSLINKKLTLRRSRSA